MQLVWHDQARNDIRELYGFLLHNRRAAQRINVAVRSALDRLLEHPALGRPGRVVSTRELAVVGTPYVIAYSVDPAQDAIVVLRILHGARRWPDDL